MVLPGRFDLPRTYIQDSHLPVKLAKRCSVSFVGWFRAQEVYHRKASFGLEELSSVLTQTNNVSHGYPDIHSVLLTGIELIF